MSIISNLYAEKIFAEHPLALWSLDEPVDYISLISEQERNIQEEWSYSNAVVSESIVDINSPFSNSITNLIEFDLFIEDNKELDFIGPDLVNFSTLDDSQGTVSIGSYFYSNSLYIQSVSIGYEYTDTTSAEIVQKFITYPVSTIGQWFFISYSGEYPDQNTELRPIIKIKHLGGATNSNQYQTYINGLSCGQWSEAFHTTSLGLDPINFPLNINLNGINKCVKANAYGLNIKDGYYLIKNNALKAKNESMPMVFGASNVTKIIPNDNLPSVIIPGLGFLNECGRYREYTFEMWLRINSNAKEPKKIFGPISSNDGLYVDDGFLVLVVGNKFKSHFIGEWYRPMLLQIQAIENSLSLVINGELVLSIDIDTKNMALPQEFTDTKSNDWLGFYSYADTTPFEIDCVALYSYKVPLTVAKRRWVFGQAVNSAEIINTAYNGTSAYIDYSFADYTSNYSYPGFAKWSQGQFDNLTVSENTLGIPDYKLPEIFLNNNKIDDWYLNCQENQNGETTPFITFRPSSTWNDVQAYINFNKFNILNDEVNAFYGIFKIKEDDLSEQILFKIENTNNGNNLIIKKDGPNIYYYLNHDNQVMTLGSINNFSVNQKFVVGIEIQKMIDTYGSAVAEFFGNRNVLTLYVGGDEYGLHTFTGNIYAMGICSEYNLQLIQSEYNSAGIADYEKFEKFLNHTASYTLLPTINFNLFYLDIGVSGYWQDYTPLSYYGGYVKNRVGERYYDLDFLQFNIDYPSPTIVKNTQETSTWTYDELYTEYSFPEVKNYGILSNFLFTGWENYEDMANKTINSYTIDTDGMAVKSYISLQTISSGCNKTLTSFNNIKPLKQDKIIDCSLDNSWINTIFEIVDNTIVYPPTSIDINDLGIVYHLEFNVRGILHNPINIKKLEIASQAFNQNALNKIGTKFGTNIYPYKKSGIYYDYKSKNPFSISKETTPYLYNTRKSGIELRGSFDPFINRGLAIAINENASKDYKINAVQTWLRYDFDKFPFGPIQIMELQYKNATVQLFAEADSSLGNRAKIIAINKETGSEVNGITFYLNGKLVRQPVIESKEWVVLGIAFANSLNLDSFSGSINLNGPFTFNNISYYKATSLQQVQKTTIRPWLKVLTDGVNDILWAYWNDSYTWDGVLIVGANNLYGVDPSDIYKSYIGTNKIIIEDDSSSNISFTADKIRIFSDVLWQSNVNTPV